MSVKKLLEKYDKDFMSLHELLCRMASTDDASYEEAAQALCKSLRETSGISAPLWYKNSLTSPKAVHTDTQIQEAFVCLEQASWYGVAPEQPTDEYELREFIELNGNLKTHEQYISYGFDRKEINQYITGLGLDIEGITPSSDTFRSGPTKQDISLAPINSIASLTERVTQVLHEKYQLQKELDSKQSQLKQLDSLKEDLGRVTSELEKALDNLASATQEKNELSTQVLSGKGRTKGLEILGTLAIKGYGIDIHAKTKKRIDEIVMDMETLGLSADEKTIRKWLNMAAEIIDKPN